jgi:predicted transcriptional regulator
LLREFERAGTLQLLHFLYNAKDYTANRTEIKQHVNTAYETIYIAIETLKKYGLINEVSVGNVPKEIRTTLTEKGIIVAKKINEFYNEL